MAATTSKTNKPTGQGVAYLRVSSGKQESDRQRADITSWLNRHEVGVERWYEDVGARDRAEFRADFQSLLADVRRRAVRWVVVQALDRFGCKDVYEFFGFLFELRKHGCQLWTSNDDACITESDELTVIRNLLGGMTSTREQIEKANRSQSKRVELGGLGVWQGGVVPYGLDVVCIRPDGSIAWRLVVQGPKNAGTVYDDRGNSRSVPGVPAHDKRSILRLDRSLRTERIETVQRIFGLYTTEAIAPGRIARMLNEEGVDPVTSPRWHDPKVRQLLANPVYLGRPASGKRSNARHREIVNGVQVEPTKTDNYYCKQGRPKPRRDWSQPESPIFEPLVDHAIFDLAQERLGKKVRRLPRSDRLYYAGLIVCAHCGERHCGAIFKNSISSYICSTRNRHGLKNKTGCRFHRVFHEDHERQPGLDPLVEQYLADQGIALEELLGTSRDRAALDHLLAEQHGKNAAVDAIVNRMKDFLYKEHMNLFGDDWKEYIKKENNLDRLPTNEESMDVFMNFLDETAVANARREFPSVDPSMLWLGAGGSLRLLYERIRGLRLDQVRAHIATLEGEHSRQFELFSGLKPGSRAALKGQEVLASLEAEMDALTASLEPLHETFDELLQDLVQLRERIAEARVAFARGSDRLRAEALQGVIREIRCRFEPRGRTGSRLVEVEIVPRIGETRKFTIPATPAPGTSTCATTSAA
jgi:hypothetical protein